MSYGVTHAAITASNGFSVPVGAYNDINCNTNTTHTLLAVENSTQKVVYRETCVENMDLRADLTEPGNYKLYEVVNSGAAALGTNFMASGNTPLFTAVMKLTPDFTDSDVGSSITGSSFTDFLARLGAFMVAKLPLILAVLAALIGLGFLLTRVRRWIGKRA